jgi:hypothetical protein
VARSDDEPDLSEIKGLLRRLEQSPPSRRPDAADNRGPEGSYGFKWRPPRRRARSTAAMLLLIANAVLATATVTSIGWYLLQPAAVEPETRADDKPVHERADAASRPPVADASSEAGPAGVAPEEPAETPLTVTTTLPSFADAADVRPGGPPPEANAEQPRTEITSLPSFADAEDVRPASPPPEVPAEEPLTVTTSLPSFADAADVRPSGPPPEVAAEKPQAEITPLPSGAEAADARRLGAPPEVTAKKQRTQITSPPPNANRYDRRDSDQELKAREVAEFCYEQRSICRKICDLHSNFDDRFDGCSHSCDSRESRCSRTGCYRWAEPEYVIAHKFGGEKCPL